MLTAWQSGVKTHKRIISLDRGQRQTSRLLQLFVESLDRLLQFCYPIFRRSKLFLEKSELLVAWNRFSSRCRHGTGVENSELCRHSRCRCRCRCRQSAGQRSSLTFSHRYRWLQTEQCVFPAHLTFLLQLLYVHRGEIAEKWLERFDRRRCWQCRFGLVNDGGCSLCGWLPGSLRCPGKYWRNIVCFAAPSSREVSSTHPRIAVHPHRLCSHGDQPKLQKLRVIREAMKRKILVSTWRSIRTAIYTTGLHHCGRKKEPRSLQSPNFLDWVYLLDSCDPTTKLSVFGLPPSWAPRPRIHGNRKQWCNAHGPHWHGTKQTNDLLMMFSGRLYPEWLLSLVDFHRDPVHRLKTADIASVDTAFGMSSCPVAASGSATAALFILGFLRSQFPVMINLHRLRLSRLQPVVHFNLVTASVDDSRRPGWTLLTHSFIHSYIYLGRIAEKQR